MRPKISKQYRAGRDLGRAAPADYYAGGATALTWGLSVPSHSG
jgi:hypothetical protein